MHKIISLLEIINQYSKNEQNNNNQILLILSTLHVLIDNCPITISQEYKKIAIILLKLSQAENFNIRLNLTNCWNSLIKYNKEIFYESSDQLFTFLILNFKFKNYDLNFSTAELFHFILYVEVNSPCEKLHKLMEARIHE